MTKSALSKVIDKVIGKDESVGRSINKNSILMEYFKGQPNDFIIRFKRGKPIYHGHGIEFWYQPYNTSIAVISTASQDAPFIFHEATASYQDVAVQGILSYRIIDPMILADKLDYTINLSTGQYCKKDHERLVQRIVYTMQNYTRSRINNLTLEAALKEVQELSLNILDDLKRDQFLSDLGIIVESLHFSSVKASPEMKEALEAEYREGLKRKADKAIYARRTAAQEEERKIRQGEMQTEIEVEQGRAALVALQSENDLKQAATIAKSEEMKLDIYVKLPPNVLLGLAMRDFAANPTKINSLSITPDLVSQISSWLNSQSGMQNGNHVQ